MKTSEMIIIGGAALVAWMYVQKATGAKLSIVPANMRVTPVQTRSQQNQQDVSAWLNVGAQAAQLYRSVFGGQASAPAATVPGSSVPATDDTLAVNPPGNVDPWEYEVDAWASIHGYD